MNLLNNAVKFCSQGYIRVGAVTDGQNIMMTVSDTGIGISGRFLKRIFEPFRQADTTLTRLNNGSGLGLAICKRLVARLDGEISVTSVEGEGSTFHVTLKNVQSTGNQSNDLSETASAAGRSMMIFASSPRVEQTIAESWRSRGYTIHAKNTEASALLEPDFIWTDLPTLIKMEPALLALLKSAPSFRSVNYPYIIVVYSTETELLPLPSSPFLIPVNHEIYGVMIGRLITATS